MLKFNTERMELETPMVRRKNELLTEVELEFMKVLWSGRVGTVRQIYAELAKETARAYT